MALQGLASVICADVCPAAVCLSSQVGSVIRSPEMAALVPALLAAIADPNASTRPCLETLLATTFINTIDAPSLALVVPVVHRGLRDRSGDTKKRAARIVGSMCTLTNDPKVRQQHQQQQCMRVCQHQQQQCMRVCQGD
jgi:hypothetical protein